MDTDNKKSVGIFITGIVLHILGITACGISGIFIKEEFDSVQAILMLLATFLYPLFFIFGTIMMVNKYYYNRRHWKYARIVSGSLLLSIGAVFFIVSAGLSNVLLALAMTYETICGIIILANQNKILPEGVSLPEEEEDGKLSIYEPIKEAVKIPPSQTKAGPVVHAPINDISKYVKKTSFETINGEMHLAKKIDRFSMSDIDTISNIENSSKKGKLFEEYVARLLEYNAYTDVSIIGGSGDLGGDIEARKANRRVIIQCKCYSGSVPYRAIQEVFSASRTRGGIPIVITNSHFSKQSIDNAEIQGVKLYDREELQKMIEIANEVIDSERSYERTRIRERIEERIEEEPVEEEIIPERHIDKKTEIEIKGKKLSEKDANKELALRMLDSYGNE